MSTAPALVYELEITALGPLVSEFTAHGIWVFFNEGAPDEVAEFAILHRATKPERLVAAGQRIEIDTEQYTIGAVGEIANENLRALGHLVLKANGAITPELPGDVCIEERPLPEPFVGMLLRIWEPA